MWQVKSDPYYMVKCLSNPLVHNIMYYRQNSATPKLRNCFPTRLILLVVIYVGRDCFICEISFLQVYRGIAEHKY